jgi:aspartyl aminopeptidase
MQKCASDFIHFVNSSRTAFHAVDTTRKRLQSAGFVELHEKVPFVVKPGGKYWFTRNQSSIVAFAVGKKWQNGNGFNIVGAHTDSPCLKVKPVSNKTSFG